ncbi:MAG: hypothetical protein Q4C65_07680 [Eubacteriales bacterium]|nr:hypothetical protein [Eubacteriales bacterium]
MADVHSGKNSFPVFPVWVLEGTSNAEEGTGRIQIIVNAVTGDEVK